MLSDHITKGVERAPNRSLLYALGLTKEGKLLLAGCLF